MYDFFHILDSFMFIEYFWSNLEYHKIFDLKLTFVEDK